MSLPVELILHSQLTAAHSTCQLLGEDRVKYRVSQLLEVALDICNCTEAAEAAAHAAAEAASNTARKRGRFMACEADVCDIEGLSDSEASTLAAVVQGLDSSYESVYTAAAQKLHHITAEWPNPSAVGDALVEAGAVRSLSRLLGASSSTCKAAAAAALCNISWYAGPRVEMLAAGAVPMLVAMLWDEDEQCRTEAAYALAALTSTQDEGVCAAVVQVGGIPRLVGLLSGDCGGSSSGSGDNSSKDGGDSGRARGDIGMSGGDINKNGGNSSSARGNIGMESGATSSHSHSTSSESWEVLHEHVPAEPHRQPIGEGASPPNEQHGTAANDDSTPAAPAPEHASSSTIPALVTLGHLAKGSANRRAAIAATGSALQFMVRCLGNSAASSSQAAAMQALLQLTCCDGWGLSDRLATQQLLAAGALSALEQLVANPPSMEVLWEAQRLRSQLEFCAMVSGLSAGRPAGTT